MSRLARWFPNAIFESPSARKMVVGLLLAVIAYLLPTPEGLSEEGHRALALFVFLIYFWATEALPLPVTALLAGVGLVVLKVVDHPNDAWSPYMQDTIVFLLGSLILADAITKTDTDKVLSARLLRRLGGHTDTLLFAILLASTLPAMLVSGHAMAAIMLPLVVSILRSTGLYDRPNIAAAYVLAIALGTGIAGVATPSGGGRNVIIIGYLDELYGIQVGYLDWALHAAPITLVLIPIVFLILKLMFKVPHEPIERGSLHLEKEKLDPIQKLTLLIFLITVIMWITIGDDIGLGTVAIIGSVALFVFGILDWVDTRRRITWGVPLIYGAALSMGAALQNTGAADWLAGTLLDLNPWDSGTALLLAALFITVILTQVMSDGGTTAVVAPITLALAAIAGVPMVEMGLATAAGAAFSFALVIGTPPNMITYTSGLFTPGQLAKAGIASALAAVLVSAAAVVWYWPMLS